LPRSDVQSLSLAAPGCTTKGDVMIMVADFTGELRLELQLPRSAAKTGEKSLVTGTDLITRATHNSLHV
jgi:hypothetical protein